MATKKAPDTDRPARERLLRAAAEIFSRKGYAATPVGEIVAAAGVTKPVLYYHFESKEGLYLTLLEEARSRLRPAIEASLQSDGTSAANRIRGLCQAILASALANLNIVRLTRSLHYSPPQAAPAFDPWEFPLTVKAAIERIVRDGVRAKEFAGNRSDDLVWAVLGLLHVCIDSHLVDARIAMTSLGFRSALDLMLGAAAGGRKR